MHIAINTKLHTVTYLRQAMNKKGKNKNSGKPYPNKPQNK